VLDENEFTTACIKATLLKRGESDSQSITKVLYHQKPLQIIICKNLRNWSTFDCGFMLKMHMTPAEVYSGFNFWWASKYC